MLGWFMSEKEVCLMDAIGGGGQFSGFGRNGLTMGVIAKSLKNVQMWNKIRKKNWILS
jgi:hypothetical protein